MDFSETNLENLTRISDELGEILLRADLSFYIDFLSEIKLSAERHESKLFKKLVLSVEIFGGSGALWEIGIEEKQLQTKFERLFCEYIDLLKKMGIKSSRVNQVRKLLHYDSANAN